MEQRNAQTMESVMNKTILMLLTSGALALPVALPAMAQNMPANQPPQAQNSEQAQNQQAANQSIPSKQLGRRGVRQMQQALNKSGHRVGRTDGIMGPRTREALQSYQKSKGMQANGKINRQILADLGVQVAQRNQGKQPANQENNSQLNQNQNIPGGNASPSTNQ
jgi:peptidoglycan hydrolase-like protein with peptidoglycan-binding domain